MKCSGVDALTGAAVEIEFEKKITAVRPVSNGESSWIAPGFIDIQVNGFAGVDYNRPETTHAEIARSIRTIWSTGVTRFYPTVITGSPADMLAALRNLARAK